MNVRHVQTLVFVYLAPEVPIFRGSTVFFVKITLTTASFASLVPSVSCARLDTPWSLPILAHHVLTLALPVRELLQIVPLAH